MQRCSSSDSADLPALALFLLFLLQLLPDSVLFFSTSNEQGSSQRRRAYRRYPIWIRIRRTGCYPL